MPTLAIVGRGEGWRRHVAGCREVGELECVEVPVMGDEAVSPDVTAVLSLPDVDAVSVCTPVRERFDAAAAVARAGKPLVIEAPIAASPDQAERLHAICRELGVPLTVLRSQRHRQLLEAVQATIASDSIGTPRFAHITSVWHWAAEDGVGISEDDFLLEYGPSSIDVAIWLMSSGSDGAGSPEHIFARATSVSEPACQIRYWSLLLVFADGVQAVLEIGRTSSVAAGTGLQSLSIIGDKGSLQHDLRNTDVVIGSGGMRPLGDDGVVATAAALTAWSTCTSDADHDQATNSLRWTLAAIDSLRTGQPAGIDR